MDKSKKRNIIVSSIILGIALVLGVLVSITYISFRYEDPVFVFAEGDSVVDGHNEHRFIQTLGDYSPTLSTYGAETKIYVTCGDEAYEKYQQNGNFKGCASILILGGTHANEPSGQLTATLILENLEVEGNTVVFIITETNRSGYSYTFPQEGAVEHYSLTNRYGNTRTFKYGGRATNPVDQWPCPDIYTVERTLPDGTTITSKLSSTDSRNLNRAYGVDNPRTYTEKVAYGITELVRQNDIKVSIDLHEASPEYQTINAIVYRNTDPNDENNTNKIAETIASNTTSAMLSDNSVEIGKAFAPESLRGLSHIELGTFTDTFMFLIESSNASQGKLRGAFVEELITYEGEDYEGDLFYDRFEDTRILYANAVSISERVARHTMSILEIIYQYNMLFFDAEGSTNTDKYLSASRLTEVESCGEFELNLRLYENNCTGENHVSDFYDSENYENLNMYDDTKLSGSWQALQAYELIYAYGVGYFLKDAE